MTQATQRPSQQDGLKDQAVEKVQDAASTVREEGSSRLRDQFDQRSNQAGSQVRSLAGALRNTRSQLDQEGNASGARLAGQTADRIDQLGQYLERKSGDELMSDLERFARRRPWMLAGLGLMAGMTAARFLKASSDERYALSRQGRGNWPNRYPDTIGSAGSTSDDPLARHPHAGIR